MHERTFVEEPLVRTSVHLRRDQRKRLARRSAETGLPVAQLIRDAVDRAEGTGPPTVLGWEISAAVRRPLDTTGAPRPPRARLREWLNRL